MGFDSDSHDCLPVMIFGTAGASKEAYYILKKMNEEKQEYHFVGFVSENENETGSVITDQQKVITSDGRFQSDASHYRRLGVVIPFGAPKLKRTMFERLSGYPQLEFPNLFYPNAALYSPFVSIGVGNIISAGVIFACDVSVGSFNLFNRGCTVGHDVTIGNFNTFNPLSVISGNDHFSDENLIGAGGIVLQNITVGTRVVVGAGAVVTKNPENDRTVAGVPAKPLFQS